MEVLLLDATMDYECLKSYCKIATSSKIFNKYNKVWSDEWNKLIKKIKETGGKNGRINSFRSKNFLF